MRSVTFYHGWRGMIHNLRHATLLTLACLCMVAQGGEAITRAEFIKDWGVDCLKFDIYGVKMGMPFEKVKQRLGDTAKIIYQNRLLCLQQVLVREETVIEKRLSDSNDDVTAQKVVTVTVAFDENKRVVGITVRFENISKRLMDEIQHKVRTQYFSTGFRDGEKKNQYSVSKHIVLNHRGGQVERKKYKWRGMTHRNIKTYTVVNRYKHVPKYDEAVQEAQWAVQKRAREFKERQEPMKSMTDAEITGKLL